MPLVKNVEHQITSAPHLMNNALIQPASAPATSAPCGGSEARILYVDDDATQRHLSALALRRLQCQATFAKDGQEAWELLQAEPFDLLITDNQMPRLDGLALVSKIRAQGGKIPVILASVSASILTPQECAKMGLSGRLPKPFTGGQLLGLIQFVLGARTALLPPQAKTFSGSIANAADQTAYLHWGINE